MEMDFSVFVSEQQRLLNEFEAVSGGKERALANECSDDFFRAVFDGNFDLASQIMRKFKEGKNYEL